MPYAFSRNSLLEEFSRENPNIPLDKIEMAISRYQKQDSAHSLLFNFLIPGPLVLFRSTNKLTRARFKTEGFKTLIEREPLLILVATTIYVVMWLYLLPVLGMFWGLFHTANWEQFFNSFFQWITFQAVVLVFVQVFFSRLAIDSFQLTKTFHFYYDLLVKQAEAEYLRPIVAAEARNRVLEIIPEIMQSLIAQSITAMIASGELNSASAQETTRIMKEITRNILLNVDDLDGFHPHTEPAIEVVEKVRSRY